MSGRTDQTQALMWQPMKPMLHRKCTVLAVDACGLYCNGESDVMNRDYEIFLNRLSTSAAKCVSPSTTRNHETMGT